MSRCRGNTTGFAQASASRLAVQAPRSGRDAALDRARTAIGALGRPEEKAAALTALLPMMSAQAAAEKDILAEIDMISPRDAAVMSLVALIPKVRAGRRQELIWQAAELTAPIKRAEDKAGALIALAGLLPAGDKSGGPQEGARELREKAVSAIGEISQAARAAAYTALASHQAAGFRSALLALALTEARAIGGAASGRQASPPWWPACRGQAARTLASTGVARPNG